MGRRCAEEDTEIEKEEVAGEWRRVHNEKLHDCTVQHVAFRDPNEEDHAGMNGGEEMCVQ